MLRMLRLWLLVGALLTASVGVLAVTNAERQALFDTFNRPPSWPISVWNQKGRQFIEVCEDVCVLASWENQERRVADSAWQALFVFEYYFNESDFADQLRKKASRTATHLLNTYDGVCPRTSDQRSQAQCILDHLTSTNGIEMFGVRYDEGFRCVVPLSTVTMRAAGTARCSKVATRK